MHATIRTGGKQYRVKVGDRLAVEKLAGAGGDEIAFGDVLLIEREGGVTVGAPTVPGARVRAKVLAQMRGEKLRIFKFRRRKNSRRTRGHRQSLTRIQIAEIAAD